MSIKEAYYYLFYKLYKFSEAAPSRWLSDWKASLALIVLEIWLIVSFLIYYKLFFNSNADIIGNKTEWVLMLFVLVLIDYFIFHNRDQWKNMIVEFNKLPKKTNMIGSWIVFVVVLLIIANFVFSLYLYYQM